MGMKRQSREVWETTRERVWNRDLGRCQGPYCAELKEWSIELNVCHIDHIKSGRLGTNADSNLRVLCRRCHVLRSDIRHQGMIKKAVEDGIIPPNYRHMVWSD